MQLFMLDRWFTLLALMPCSEMVWLQKDHMYGNGVPNEKGGANQMPFAIFPPKQPQTVFKQTSEGASYIFQVLASQVWAIRSD